MMTQQERIRFECANLNRKLAMEDKVIFLEGRAYLVMTRATVTKQRKQYCEPFNMERTRANKY